MLAPIGKITAPAQARATTSTMVTMPRMILAKDDTAYREARAWAGKGAQTPRLPDPGAFTAVLEGKALGGPHLVKGDKARLRMGSIVDKSGAGGDELSNLHVLYPSCNQGARNCAAEKSGAIWLQDLIRRVGEPNCTP